jgi:DNA-binding MurR/RpiR family transcriptional regulator
MRSQNKQGWVIKMSRDILDILQEKAPTFSKGQRKIAQYITECYDKAAFMTANRLGKTVGISESTVVRFAVDLGFDGYPSMQKAMQEMVLNRLTSVQRIEVASGRYGDQDVVSMVLHADMEKLRQTDENLSRADFQASVDAILKAKRIYILGVRSVAPLANFLGYYLNYMFQNVHILTASGTSEMFEKIVGVNSKDAVIAFSFPRYSATTLKTA